MLLQQTSEKLNMWKYRLRMTHPKFTITAKTRIITARFFPSSLCENFLR